MDKYVNNCCNCAIGCIDCGRKHQLVKVCDVCGSQGQLFKTENGEFCKKHLESVIKKSIMSDFATFFDEAFDCLCDYFGVEEVKK